MDERGIIRLILMDARMQAIAAICREYGIEAEIM